MSGNIYHRIHILLLSFTSLSLFTPPCLPFILPCNRLLHKIHDSSINQLPHHSFILPSSRSLLYAKQPERQPTFEINEESNQIITFDKIKNLSRKDAILFFIGGIAYAKLATTVLMKIQRGEAYPSEHERRAADTFEVTLTSAASYRLQHNNNKNELSPRPLRVLEIGVGTSCRTFLRGMYDDSIREVITLERDNPGLVDGIDFIGVDIDMPKRQEIVEDARDHLNNIDPSNPIPITLELQSGDVTTGLPFPDGYFGKFPSETSSIYFFVIRSHFICLIHDSVDAITSSLVLCSVQDQGRALDEVKRLLNPNGGCFGFIEHVSVNVHNEAEKDLAFLEWQQWTLDPLQQVLAHNCHLHRNTDSFIEGFFLGDDNKKVNSMILQRERFQISDMWPVSCQSRGVVQLMNV